MASRTRRAVCIAAALAIATASCYSQSYLVLDGIRRHGCNVKPDRTSASSSIAGQAVLLRHRVGSHKLARVILLSATSSNAPAPTSSDPVLRIPLLESRIACCDNETSRAELEEELGRIKADAEFGVLRAQIAFYDAFSSGDFDKLAEAWSLSDENVRCAHPGARLCSGREQVMASWKQVLRGSGLPQRGFSIRPLDQKVDICGKTAFCTCVEEALPTGSRLQAINIFEREDDQWKMIFHQAGPIF